MTRPSTPLPTEIELGEDAPLAKLMQVIEEKVASGIMAPPEATASGVISPPEELEPAPPQRVGRIPFRREEWEPETEPADDSVETPARPRVLRGSCNVCGWVGEFLEPARGREGHFCGNCASSSRHRMVIQGLSMVLRMEGRVAPDSSLPLYAWPRDHHLRILEPSGRGTYPSVLADRFQYHGIEYDPERVDPEHPHRGYGDLQDLHFDDESFAVVIASDVFEHVRDDDAGFRQIHRVLRDGGALVLTVPYRHEQKETIARVDTSGAEDLPLLPPVYHSGGGQTLVYRDYGRDLLSKLRRMGFSVVHLEEEFDAHGIPRQSLILAFKKDFVEWVSVAGAESRDSRRRDIGAGPRRHQPSQLGPLLPQRLYLLLKFNLQGFAQQVRQLVQRFRAR